MVPEQNANATRPFLEISVSLETNDLFPKKASVTPIRLALAEEEMSLRNRDSPMFGATTAANVHVP